MTSTFPVSRIKTIMKSSPEVAQISHDAALLVGRATELFIQFLTNKATDKSHNVKKLDYKDVAEVVQDDDRLDFLREMVPRKITVREFKDILKKKKRQMTKTTESANGDVSSSNETGSDDDADDSEDSTLSEEEEDDDDDPNEENNS